MSTQNITKTMVNAMDLTSMSSYVFQDTVQYFLASQSTYKLLAYLSSVSNDQNLLMCETRSGEYAVAFAINLTSKVTTIDRWNLLQDFPNSIPSIPNLTIVIDDITTIEGLNKYKDLILSTSVFCINMADDPHGPPDGNIQYTIYKFLLDNNYQGVIIFDQIYYGGLPVNLWAKIDDQYKVDVTFLAGGNGTGVVQFNKKFTFENI
jgi:hypothetical protein